jgi:hypothetical protein
MFYLCDSKGVEQGPFSGEQVKQWVREKHCNIFTPAKRAGEKTWKMIGSFTDLSVTRDAPMPPAFKRAKTQAAPAHPAANSLSDTNNLPQTNTTTSIAPTATVTARIATAPISAAAPQPPPEPVVETSPTKFPEHPPLHAVGPATTFPHEPLPNTAGSYLYAQARALKAKAQAGAKVASNGSDAASRLPSADASATSVPPPLPPIVSSSLNITAHGTFVKKRVGAMTHYGQFRGKGSISLADDSITFEGKHVYSLGARWGFGLAFFFISLILTLGMFAPGFILIYLVVEYLWLKRARITVPLSAIKAIALDPAGKLLAIDFPSDSAASPAVLKCAEAEVIHNHLRTKYPA